MSSIVAVAIGIAQRMSMHDESTYTRCMISEAEMHRRLWWSLVIFDYRICEVSDYKTTTLSPICDYRILLNVNDFEIRLEMKTLLAIYEKPTEALFAVVRSELADFVRHSTFHLNFINPSLNAIAQPTQHSPKLKGSGLMALEKTIEDKYLAFCDPENPLHFMIIWTTRGHLTRIRLLEYYSRHSTSSIQQTDAQRNGALSHALSMLECDTKLKTLPPIKRYLWFLDLHIPALAYVHILNSLRKRPIEDLAEKAWDAMSDSYEARAMHSKPDKQQVLAVFFRVVLQTWGAREALFKRQNKLLESPRIVSDIRNKVTQITSTFSLHSNGERPNGAAGINVD